MASVIPNACTSCLAPWSNVPPITRGVRDGSREKMRAAYIEAELSFFSTRTHRKPLFSFSTIEQETAIGDTVSFWCAYCPVELHKSSLSNGGEKLRGAIDGLFHQFLHYLRRLSWRRRQQEAELRAGRLRVAAGVAQGQRVHPGLLPVRVANAGDHPQHLLHPQRDPQRLVVSPSTDIHHRRTKTISVLQFPRIIYLKSSLFPCRHLAGFLLFLCLTVITAMVIPRDGISGRQFEDHPSTTTRSYWGDLMLMANMTGALKHEAAASCLLLPPPADLSEDDEEKIPTSCPPNTSSSSLSHHHVALIQVLLPRLHAVFSY